MYFASAVFKCSTHKGREKTGGRNTEMGREPLKDEKGMALVIALLSLLLVTIIGISAI